MYEEAYPATHVVSPVQPVPPPVQEVSNRHRRAGWQFFTLAVYSLLRRDNSGCSAKGEQERSVHFVYTAHSTKNHAAWFIYRTARPCMCWLCSDNTTRHSNEWQTGETRLAIGRAVEDTSPREQAIMTNATPHDEAWNTLKKRIDYVKILPLRTRVQCSPHDAPVGRKDATMTPGKRIPQSCQWLTK